MSENLKVVGNIKSLLSSVYLFNPFRPGETKAVSKGKIGDATEPWFSFSIVMMTKSSSSSSSILHPHYHGDDDDAHDDDPLQVDGDLHDNDPYQDNECDNYEQ